MKLPTLEFDKANHWVYGSVLAAVGALFDPLAGALLCNGFAIGKEIRDRVTGKGTPDRWDALWTMIGGAVVLLPFVFDIYKPLLLA